MEKTESQAEPGKCASVSHWRQVRDQGLVTPEVLKWNYEGSGTEEDPYVVVWIDNDPRNPMRWSALKRWLITALVAIATLAVAFCSSAFSGGVTEIIEQFECSQEVATLGISLFVLGFAVGPLLWAPLSELFGRQVLYITTYMGLTVSTQTNPGTWISKRNSSCNRPSTLARLARKIYGH